MEVSEILSHVDHTLLNPTATWQEIKGILDDAMSFGVASACIPPSFVKQAKDYVSNKLAICTVIGFPNGYNTTKTKIYETQDALQNGADEIDMVINIGDLRSLNYQKVTDEIGEIKKVCGDKLLKVIIEVCLLTEEEKIKMCEIVTYANADYIKTSTGFSNGGATRADIVLFKEYIGKQVKIKAAGGIRSFDDAKDYLALGCDRLGTSALVALAKKQNADTAY